MRRKVSGALSLLLTVTVLGTSVPSVVLAEDFGQQSEIQWDSEEKEATGVSEEQELPKENESESDEPQESDDFTADISEEPESDPTQDQAPEPTQIPDQDIQQEVHAEDISMDEEKLTTAEERERCIFFSAIKVPFPDFFSRYPWLSNAARAFLTVTRLTWYCSLNSFSVGSLLPGVSVPSFILFKINSSNCL